MTIAKRPHLFPSRTQKLSSLAPMILGGKLPGKVGRCRFFYTLSLKAEYEKGSAKKLLKKLRKALDYDAKVWYYR